MTQRQKEIIELLNEIYYSNSEDFQQQYNNNYLSILEYIVGCERNIKMEELNNVEQPPKWTEEDERCMNDIMWCISAYRENGFCEMHFERADRAENWIRTLEQKIRMWEQKIRISEQEPTLPERGDIIRITRIEPHAKTFNSKLKEGDLCYVTSSWEIEPYERRPYGIKFVRIRYPNGKTKCHPIRSTVYKWEIVRKKCQQKTSTPTHRPPTAT